MTVTVTLQLDDVTWRRAHRLAQQQQQDVADALVTWLAETLPTPDSSGAMTANDSEDAAVEREMQAYLALHPHLEARYLGEYVAILDGRLIDHDADYGALFDRIDAQFPDLFVWMTQVTAEPIRTLAFRSPRMEPLARSR